MWLLCLFFVYVKVMFEYMLDVISSRVFLLIIVIIKINIVSIMFMNIFVFF